MGLGEFVQSGFKLDYLFMPEGSSDTAKAVATHQSKLVQEQHAKGLIDAEKQSRMLSEIAGTTTYDTYFEDPANRPTVAFVDELKNQVTKLPRNIRDTIGSIVNLPFKLIPGNLWVLIFLALAIYLAWKLNVLARFAYKAK